MMMVIRRVPVSISLKTWYVSLISDNYGVWSEFPDQGFVCDKHPHAENGHGDDLRAVVNNSD